MNNDLYVLFFLKVVLFSSKLFNRVVLAETTQISGNDIIKDCNGILYRLMVDFGEPPFPETACDIKQKVISCFERSQGFGDLLDQDRFLLLQSAMVDKTLMCPDLEYEKLEKSIQNSAAVQALFCKYPKVTVPLSGPEKCAVDIHKSCEKKIFDQMVVNHFPWPKTTKWRECYNKALMRTSCTARILQNYATLQREFGENLRQQEYSSGLFGIFMNDNQLSLQL